MDPRHRFNWAYPVFYELKQVTHNETGMNWLTQGSIDKNSGQKKLPKPFYLI